MRGSAGTFRKDDEPSGSSPLGPVTLGDLAHDDKLLWVYCTIVAVFMTAHEVECSKLYFIASTASKFSVRMGWMPVLLP